MSFSIPFSIQDLHCLKPFKSHVPNEKKVSQMNKHVDIKPLAKFRNDWINQSL